MLRVQGPDIVFVILLFGGNILENSAIPCVQFVLKQSMMKAVISSYSISKYCKSARMSRSTFYRTFENGKVDLLYKGLEESLKDSLMPKKFDKTMRMSIYRGLKEIEAEKNFYLSIYKITRMEDRSIIRVRLKKLAYQIVMKYADKFEGLPKRKGKTLGNLIYNNISEWITHGCLENVNEIYQQLELLLPQVEGHRCSDNNK